MFILPWITSTSHFKYIDTSINNNIAQNYSIDSHTVPDFLSVVHEWLNVELPLKSVHEGDRVVLDLIPVDDVQLARLVLQQPPLQVLRVLARLQAPRLQCPQRPLGRGVGGDNLVEGVGQGGGIIVGPHVLGDLELV